MPATPADVKLYLFNRALTHLGSRNITSLTEARESQRVLSAIWDAAFVDFVLEAGQWKFAMRTMALTYSPSVEPAFGYKRAFDKPTDLKRLSAFSTDAWFREPFLYYMDTKFYWFAEPDTIYVRYVSNDPAYGGDYAGWTATFQEYVALILAKRAAPRIKNETTVATLEALGEKALAEAQALDAMADPTKRTPQGRWGHARMAGASWREQSGSGR